MTVATRSVKVAFWWYIGIQHPFFVAGATLCYDTMQLFAQHLVGTEAAAAIGSPDGTRSTTRMVVSSSIAE